MKYDSNGYAEFVLVTDYTVASNTFLAYVTNKPFTNLTYPGNKTIPGYTVYKIGTDEKTVVYDAKWENDEVEHNTVFWNAFKADNAGAGLYEIEVTDDMFVKAMNLVVADKNLSDRVEAPSDYDYVVVGNVKANLKGESILVERAYNQFFDYNIGADTLVFNVTKYTNETVLEKGSVADIEKDSKILFAYDDNSDKNGIKLDAKVVYVLETVEDVETPVTAPSLTLKQNAPGQVQATYKSGSKATSVYVEYYYREAGDTSAKWNVLYTGTEHNYVADGSEVYSAKDLPTLGGSNKYDVYAVAYATKDLADYNKGDVVATSNTLKDIIA